MRQHLIRRAFYHYVPHIDRFVTTTSCGLRDCVDELPFVKGLFSEVDGFARC